MDSRIAHAAPSLYVEVDEEFARDAAAAGVILKPKPSPVLGQVVADTLVLQNLHRMLQTVATRRSKATARTVRPLDVLAGLVERLGSELEVEAAIPRSQNKE